jgi:hypothetical protein
MVVKDPNKRIKIKSIIQHEWLRSTPIKDYVRKRRSTLELPSGEHKKEEDSKSNGKYGYSRGVTVRKFPKLEIAGKAKN